jgi:hypothetical protein
MEAERIVNDKNSEQSLAKDTVDYLQLLLPQLDRFEGITKIGISDSEPLKVKLMFISQSGRRSGIACSMKEYDSSLHHIYNPGFIAGQMMIAMLHHLYSWDME